jgi:hypothetical protein
MVSQIKVNEIIKQSGSSISIGESGDTISIPSGATIANSGTATGFGDTNSPYARLGFSSAPAVDSGTFKIAEYNNILFASDNSIVDTSAYKITPGVAGKYYIAAHINYAQNAVDQKDYHLLIYVDGSNKIRNAIHASGNHSTYGTDVFVSGTLDLTATNYVQVKVYQVSGSSAQYAYGDTTGIKNYFELFRIAT